jgi:DNA-binding NarL/FixJ family response regulator
LLELVSQEVTVEGVTKMFEFARRAPGVRMIISAQDGSGKILLTREYRPSLERYDYRLPGGKVFDSLQELHEHIEDIDE